MKRLVEKLVWTEWNIEHIKKHKVTKMEADWVYETSNVKVLSHSNRIIILGETKKRRLLSIIVSYTNPKKPYVVSARDMSRKERIIYDLQTQTN